MAYKIYQIDEQASSCFIVSLVGRNFLIVSNRTYVDITFFVYYYMSMKFGRFLLKHPVYLFFSQKQKKL